jgi:hypothetical protein
MKRLGYQRYVAQGGDWGAIVTEQLAVQAPPELLGIHVNMPEVVPPEINDAAFAGKPVPAGLSADEKHAYEMLVSFYKDVYYAFFMGTRPQTLTALSDSPVGLATFLIDHDRRSLELIARSFDGVPEGLTRDDVLDNATLFWLTNTGVSAAAAEVPQRRDPCGPQIAAVRRGRRGELRGLSRNCSSTETRLCDISGHGRLARLAGCGVRAAAQAIRRSRCGLHERGRARRRPLSPPDRRRRVPPWQATRHPRR